MDFLQANVEHLLPAAPVEEDELVNLEEHTLSLKSDVLDIVKGILPAYEVTNRSLPVTAATHDDASWNRRTATTILNTTHNVCLFYANVKRLDQAVLIEPLTLLADILVRVASTGRLFDSGEEHEKYKRAARRIVKLAVKIVDSFDARDIAFDEIEHELTKMVHQHEGVPEKDEWLWPAWSSNNVEVGGEEQRKAIVRKTAFKAMSMYLPRGGYAIAEQWREDVDGVVGAILEVKPSKEAESQKTSQHGTYAATNDRADQPFTQSRIVMNQPSGSMENEPMWDHLGMVGRLMGEVDGLELPTPGQVCGVWEHTYMDVSQMREGRKERASRLEEFGREW